MGWKDWSSTKKGASVGGIIGLIGIILVFVGSTFSGLFQNPLLVISFGGLSIFLSLLCMAGGGFACGVITIGVGIILTLIAWTIIGAVIGWILGKIKHKWTAIIIIIILVILFIALGIYSTQVY